MTVLKDCNLKSTYIFTKKIFDKPPSTSQGFAPTKHKEKLSQSINQNPTQKIFTTLFRFFHQNERKALSDSEKTLRQVCLVYCT